MRKPASLRSCHVAELFKQQVGDDRVSALIHAINARIPGR